MVQNIVQKLYANGTTNFRQLYKNGKPIYKNCTEKSELKIKFRKK